MRILHVYSGNLFGGIETALATLARHRGACPSVEHEAALCFDGRLRRELAAAGLRVHTLPSPRASRPQTVASARRALAALLRREHFDAVLCHAAWPQALFGGVVERAGVPLVCWAHDAATGRHWTERWARRLRPDLVIANSAYTAGSIRALYPRAPIEVVRVPVEISFAEPSSGVCAGVRRSLDTPADAVVVLQASRMEPWKGHATLIEALARLEDDRRWACWIAGGAQRPREGRYEASIRALARTRGLDRRVHFVGERSDVPALLAAADIYCQPNTTPEPFGIVFVEALAAGRPVVATNEGGVVEIVDDSCGRLVEPGDVDALVATLRALIADSDLRRALAAAGPARARALCDPAAQVRALGRVLLALPSAARATA